MATIYQRGKTYWIKWYENGCPKYESLRTSDKKRALTAKAAKELELRTGGTVAQTNCTLEEFKDEYLLWHKGEYPWLEEERRSIFERSLIPSLGPLRLASIPPQEVELWKHKRLRDGCQRSSVNLELKVLKAALNKAVEWKIIPNNPITYVRPFQILESNPRRFFTSEELHAIYRADPDKAPIWKLMANTGLRTSEAKSLRWEYVLPGVVRVVSTAHNRTKSRRWRDIPISPGCREALDALPRTGDFVLPRVGKTTLRDWFKRTAKKAGLEGTPHELRHTFISHLVMQGVPLRTVQVLAGHSSITVTEQYAHLAPDHMAGAVQGLSL